ncbi:MAG: histidinol dehydrogenase [Anaeroplasma sp.]|nr:histidinol dehydrogenase [Anaeroplasma sp.]
MIEIIKSEKEIQDFFKVLKNRGCVSSGNYLDIVKRIIEDIQIRKDEALSEYTKKFDDINFDINKIEVSKEEQKKAFDSLDSKMKEVLLKAKDRIYDYHTHQKRETFTYEGVYGERLGQKITPLETVGVYVPGGKAAYPSSVLMNVMPAKVANVGNIIMVSPAPKGYINPLVLAAAYVCEVDHFYKIGGAQAIAALAYGTESIPKVDKIVGPGNIFVTLAKKEVFGTVGIDSIAGPSEILVIGDSTTNVKYCAADLLGQAEHDQLASSILLITDYNKAKEIQKQVLEYYETSSRKNILDVSLNEYSKIIVTESVEKSIEYANMIAPEHLELAMDDANNYIEKIKNAGAIFIGHYSPEALGDYMAGPNHVLPTVGTSRFFSPLGVDDFIKKSSLIQFTKESANMLISDVDTFAMAEGLEMHALSARVRGEE